MAKHSKSWFSRRKNEQNSIDSPYDGFILPVQSEEIDFGEPKDQENIPEYEEFSLELLNQNDSNEPEPDAFTLDILEEPEEIDAPESLPEQEAFTLDILEEPEEPDVPELQPEQFDEDAAADPFGLSIIDGMISDEEDEDTIQETAEQKKAKRQAEKQQKRISKEERLIRKYEEEIEREKQGKKRSFKDFLKLILPWKGDDTAEKIRKSVLVIAILAFFVSAIFLANYAIASLKSRATGDAIRDLYKNPDYDLTGVDFPEGANEADFAALYAQNPDTVGWIHVPNTNIDNVVVRYTDNDFYLNHDFYKKYSEHGTIMADFRTLFSVAGNSKNVTLYGHHMQDGTMFAQLEKYRTFSFYKQNPVIYFDTIYAKGEYEVFSVFITNDLEEQDNGYRFNFNKVDFATQADFEKYVVEVERRSLYNTNVTVSYTDTILTLSTCVYDFTEARLVVCARRLLDGEEPAETATAIRNPAPLYPQAWYDKKGGSKPTFNDPVYSSDSTSSENSSSTSSDASSSENSSSALPSIPGLTSSSSSSTGSSTTPPAGGGEGTTPPAGGGEGTTPPAGEGEGTTPPAGEGEGTTPPAGEGEGTTPPAGEGEGTTPPAGEGEGTTPPAGEGEGTTPPAGEGEGTTPPAGEGE